MSKDDDIPNVYIDHGSHSIDREIVELVVTYPQPPYLEKNNGSLKNFDTINEIFFEENDIRMKNAIVRIQEKEGVYIAIADENDYGMTLFVQGRDNAVRVADFLRNVRTALNNDKRMNVTVG